MTTTATETAVTITDSTALAAALQAALNTREVLLYTFMDAVCDDSEMQLESDGHRIWVVLSEPDRLAGLAAWHAPAEGEPMSMALTPALARTILATISSGDDTCQEGEPITLARVSGRLQIRPDWEAPTTTLGWVDPAPLNAWRDRTRSALQAAPAPTVPSLTSDQAAILHRITASANYTDIALTANPDHEDAVDLVVTSGPAVAVMRTWSDNQDRDRALMAHLLA